MLEKISLQYQPNKNSKDEQTLQDYFSREEEHVVRFEKGKDFPSATITPLAQGQAGFHIIPNLNPSEVPLAIAQEEDVHFTEASRMVGLAGRTIRLAKLYLDPATAY